MVPWILSWVKRQEFDMDRVRHISDWPEIILVQLSYRCITPILRSERLEIGVQERREREKQGPSIMGETHVEWGRYFQL